MLTEGELGEVAKRIARGEALRPSATRIEAARGLLRGEKPLPTRSLSAGERAGLVALAMVLTPFCAVAVAWAYRESPAGKQAAIIAGATLSLDFVLAAGSIWS